MRAGIERLRAVLVYDNGAESLTVLTARELTPDSDGAVATKRENIAPDATAVALDVENFEIPSRFRERFKDARERTAAETEDAQESPEDFGIDPDSATYKYDTGGGN